MRRLRICYVLATAAAGTGYHAAMLAEGADERGMRVAVFGPPGTVGRFFPDAGEGEDGIRFGEVEIADRPRPGSDIQAIRRLRGLLASEDPHVVHAHGTRAGAFAALALGPASRGRPGLVPAFVVTMHNAPPRGVGAGLVYRGLERVVVRRADSVLCASPDLAERMRRLGARGVGRAVVPAPVADVPTEADVARVRDELGGAGRPVVLAVGRLAEQKGFGVLLEAAVGWQGREPRPLVVVAGEGPLAGELAQEARRRGVEVLFPGPRRDVPALLAAADVVVVPSYWEARALIVQEALVAGRPVVASRVGGIPELTGEDAAVLVPPGDAGALAEAVAAVLDDAALAGRLAAAARVRGAALPSAGDAVDAALAVYERLAAEPRQRA